MNSQSKKLLKLLPIISGGMAGVLLGYLLFRPGAEYEPAIPAPGKESQTWTCSMHPQVQLPGPGKCPICAMDLISLGEGHLVEDGANASPIPCRKSLGFHPNDPGPKGRGPEGTEIVRQGVLR